MLRSMVVMAFVGVMGLIHHQAHGYIRARLTLGEPSAPSHVFVVGKGADMGTQFQSVALSKLAKIREVEPGAQFLWVSAVEGSYDQSRRALGAVGFSGVQSVGGDLSAEAVVRELASLEKIASVHVVGHNSPHYGTMLEGTSIRLNWNDPGMARLREKMTDDSYVMLHGCNSGFYFGPQLSEAWQVPVFGSLTSTAFQRLHKNGKFYVNDPGQYPAGGWSSENAASFDKPFACPQGECLRLKPDWIPYSGKWGDFSLGLAHYQGFCVGVSEHRCLRGYYLNALHMVSDQRTHPSPALSEFKAVLADWFCPNDATDQRQEACRTSLDAAEKENRTSFSPFAGVSLPCHQNGCKFEMSCRKFFGKIIPKCTLRSLEPTSRATVIDEYRAYLRAFEMFGTRPLSGD